MVMKYKYSGYIFSSNTTAWFGNPQNEYHCGSFNQNSFLQPVGMPHQCDGDQTIGKCLCS